MSTEIKNQVKELGNLVADGYNGYHTAAENVKNPVLKSMFGDLKVQKQNNLKQLDDSTMKDYEFSVNDNGTAKGFFHRTWMNTKSAFTNNDSQIVSEAIRGEEEALETYQKTLDKDVSTNLRSVMNEQKTGLEASIIKLKSIENTLK